MEFSLIINRDPRVQFPSLSGDSELNPPCRVSIFHSFFSEKKKRKKRVFKEASKRRNNEGSGGLSAVWCVRAVGSSREV
jgi:hypothetical protein